MAKNEELTVDEMVDQVLEKNKEKILGNMEIEVDRASDMVVLRSNIGPDAKKEIEGILGEKLENDEVGMQFPTFDGDSFGFLGTSGFEAETFARYAGEMMERERTNDIVAHVLSQNWYDVEIIDHNPENEPAPQIDNITVVAETELNPHLKEFLQDETGELGLEYEDRATFTFDIEDGEIQHKIEDSGLSSVEKALQTMDKKGKIDADYICRKVVEYSDLQEEVEEHIGTHYEVVETEEYEDTFRKMPTEEVVEKMDANFQELQRENEALREKLGEAVEIIDTLQDNEDQRNKSKEDEGPEL